MRIHPPTLLIDENAPFKDALFGRKAFGESLTSLLRNVSDNLVVLVHAPWGEGKTTFARMWQADLKRQKLNIVYFDAYASDYFNDPFVCFSGEILELADKRLSEGKGLIERKEFRKTAVEVGKRLAGLATKIALKSATLGALEETHIKELKDIGSDIASGIAEIGAATVEQKIKSYAAERNSLAAFKKSLAKLAALIREEQDFPLTIIVDELDRCRPNFALALLERIKHLFDVEGVAFLLLVNRDQIESYIRSVYGDVDARAYLLKFANLFVDLPCETEHTIEYVKGRPEYCDTLFDHFEFSKTVPDARFLSNCLKTLSDHFRLTLRELEKLFAILTVYYASLAQNEITRHLIVAILATLKLSRPGLYDRLSRGQVSVENFFVETRLDQVRKWVGDMDPEWARNSLRVCLMSDSEYKEALDDEAKQKNIGTNLEDIRGHLFMDRRKAIPFFCSRLDRFELKL
jgi:hypothetical protein